MEASKTEKRSGELTLREAMLPAKVSDWRAKLSTKAKQEKRFRFYSLYGLIGHAETLKGGLAAGPSQGRSSRGRPDQHRADRTPRARAMA
jgi:hypothetical protein